LKQDLPGQLELPVPEAPNAPVLRGVVGLITPLELCTALNIAEQTLASWRTAGTGPDFVKLGKGVFYRLADVQAWVAASVTRAVTSGPGA
jgi:hypothetical protein